MELMKHYADVPFYLREKLVDGNVFFSEEYSQYAAATGAHVWYVFDDNYVLPVNVSEKVKIKQALYLSEPMMIGASIDNRAQVKFLNGVSTLMKKEGIAWTFTSAAALFDSYPDDSQRIPFGSHVIDLTIPEDDLLMKMHSKHRNSVRRADRNGVTVVSGGKEMIADYLKADADTWKRSGRDSYGRKFFERIINNLGNKAALYVAYKENEPQSGACYFYNKKMSYYMYGASITKPEPGATNLLQWKAMLDMKEKGVEKFSFVGCRMNEDKDSKYHGIQRFKERFGGKLYQGYMFKCVLSPAKYKLFRKLYKAKKGIELTDAVDQEISKWPELQMESIEE